MVILWILCYYCLRDGDIFLFLVKVNKCNLIDKIGWLRNEL